MGLIVCDIDGTLTKVGDRLKCLKQSPKDWDSFYARCGEDKPNQKIINLVEDLNRYPRNDVLLLTGRRESCSSATRLWLNTNAPGLYCSPILFRENDDRRHDTEVKPELLSTYLWGHSLEQDAVDFILEDRTSMVKKWRELGYTCLQVADGDF